jgi:hypothetical protein
VSQMTLAPINEVISAWSYGGEHSMTSIPVNGAAATSSMNFSTSRGRLGEGADAREVRQLASGERGDTPVDDGVGSRGAELEPASGLVFECNNRKLGL